MNITEFPDLERAREEASLWVARLDRRLLPAEDRELRAWCEASPANARALRQMSALWADLEVMKALAEVLPEGLEPLTRPQDTATAAVAAAMAPAEAATPAAPRARRRVRPALAASLLAGLIVAGAGVFLHQRGIEPAVPALAAAPAEPLHTAIGEQRDFTLDDGSSLAVNTGSLVEVLRLDASARELRLRRGEAVFSVAHDPDRPFRVAVGGHTVEAVGTEFDIRLYDEGVIEVVVTEGRVRLLAGTAVTGMLDHGQAMRIGVDGTTRVTDLDDSELAARLAWRRGMIEFRGQPLAEALVEFSRYTPVRFVVTDPDAARTPIGGTIPAGDVDSLLEALRTNFGFISSRGPDGSIRISAER